MFQVKLIDSGAFSYLYVINRNGFVHEVVSIHLLEPQFEQHW